MAGFIFAILIFLAAIVIGIVMLCNDIKAGGAGVLIGGILLSILILVLSCVGSIPTGCTGLVVTFGRVENVTLDAGICWTKPWQHIVTMDNRVQKQTVELQAFSSDIQEVSVKYTLNYQIDKENATVIYSTIGVNYYDTVVPPATAESLKTVTARYTAEELVSNRDKLAFEVEELLSESLSNFNVNIVSTSIEDIDFTDAFTDAVEAKQVAQQNKLKAQTEAEQKVIEAEANAKVQKVNAEAEAEVNKIKADAEAYAVRIKAEAEAEANKEISASLTQELIDYVKANGWDGKLPVYSGDGGSFIFNTTDK